MLQTISNLMQKRTHKFQCEKHGMFEKEVICNSDGSPMFKPRCPECVKEAQAEWEAGREERERQALIEQKRKEAEARHNRLHFIGVPEEYINKTFKCFSSATDSSANALNLTRRFVNGWEKAKEGGYGLLFFGSCGTGKTHLACAAIQEILDTYQNPEPISMKYTRTMDLIREYRETWSDKEGRSESDVIQYYSSLDLLVLDEVGVQSGSSNEQQILFSILDRRVTNSKPTILISNLNRKDIQTLLGERLFDRIQSKCVPCVFTGKSHRKPATAEVFG